MALLIKSDLFTPLAQTPWGGDVITRKYKSRILPKRIGESVGESWEFSCDPKMPSQLAQGEMLAQYVKAYEEEVLGPLARRQGHRDVEILVKIVNSRSSLSVQVHPRDDDAHLKSGECGKPESWLVLEAEPGAGIYIGFSRPIGKSQLREAFKSSGPEAKDLMHFVPVKAGDYFDIEPGVPHAIGAGVTLLEPQRILHGKSGKTYRFWDWGRRYLPSGEEAKPNDPLGKSRELHLEEALQLVNPEVQVGETFVSHLRRAPRSHQFADGGVLREYPKNEYYQVLYFDAVNVGQALSLGMGVGYGAVTVLRGKFRVVGVTKGGSGDEAPQGQSLLMPFAEFPVSFVAEESDSALAVVVPAWAQWGFYP